MDIFKYHVDVFLNVEPHLSQPNELLHSCFEILISFNIDTPYYNCYHEQEGISSTTNFFILH